ncbi:hypothetical protein Ae706Ps2_6299c [Pseudonocardia sp. Ae706_Ps2]|nr:hypothetical protein Ae706Ps2_6299c [Pseudonocardia sp. Ae706_Ps2]
MDAPTAGHAGDHPAGGTPRERRCDLHERQAGKHSVDITHPPQPDRIIAESRNATPPEQS